MSDFLTYGIAMIKMVCPTRFERVTYSLEGCDLSLYFNGVSDFAARFVARVAAACKCGVGSKNPSLRGQS